MTKIRDRIEVGGDFKGLVLPPVNDPAQLHDLHVTVTVTVEDGATKVVVEGQEIRAADAWQALRTFIGPGGVQKTGVVRIDGTRYALDRFAAF